MLKKVFLILSLLNFLQSALADTFPLIAYDSSYGKIVIQGKDGDAKRLYDEMLVSQTSNEATIVKKEILSLEGQLKITCSKSLRSGKTSCVLSIKQGNIQTYINHNDKEIFINILGKNGNELYQKFKSHGAFYQFLTNNQKLIIYGKKDNFMIKYQHNND